MEFSLKIELMNTDYVNQIEFVDPHSSLIDNWGSDFTWWHD